MKFRAQNRLGRRRGAGRRGKERNAQGLRRRSGQQLISNINFAMRRNDLESERNKTALIVHHLHNQRLPWLGNLAAPKLFISSADLKSAQAGQIAKVENTRTVRSRANSPFR